MVAHRKSGTFTPNFSWFWDFKESVFKCLISIFEIRESLSLWMLKLDQYSPEPSGGEVGLETFLDHLLSFFELPEPHEHHDSLELNLPFVLALSLRVRHYLKSSLWFFDHFEILCIFKQSIGKLLLWDFYTSSFDAKTGFFHHSLV